MNFIVPHTDTGTSSVYFERPKSETFIRGSSPAELRRMLSGCKQEQELSYKKVRLIITSAARNEIFKLKFKDLLSYFDKMFN
jgi:hypothetical protein